MPVLVEEIYTSQGGHDYPSSTCNCYHSEEVRTAAKYTLPSVFNEGFFFLWRCDLTRVMASSFLRSLDHTQRSTPVDRIPLDEQSARRRDLYLTHNTHNRHTSMGFETTISAGERPQTSALEGAATGTGTQWGMHGYNPYQR
jgi:hypothetical protein